VLSKDLELDAVRLARMVALIPHLDLVQVVVVAVLVLPLPLRIPRGSLRVQVAEE